MIYIQIIHIYFDIRKIHSRTLRFSLRLHACWAFNARTMGPTHWNDNLGDLKRISVLGLPTSRPGKILSNLPKIFISIHLFFGRVLILNPLHNGGARGAALEMRGGGGGRMGGGRDSTKSNFIVGSSVEASCFLAWLVKLHSWNKSVTCLTLKVSHTNETWLQKRPPS